MIPEISIVIPSYNRPQLLDRLLQSIKNQSFENYEVIVVDDHSSKWSEIHQVINGFKESIPGIKVFRNEANRGLSHSRNVGALNSRAEWVAFVDDDDEWMPRKLEKQRELIRGASEKIALIYTWSRVERNGEFLRVQESINEGDVLLPLLKENFIPASSVVVRKSALIEAGLFDEKFMSCEDWDMWVRLTALGYQVKVVKSHEMIYHKHAEWTMGESESAHIGYQQFYEKHLHLYRKVDPYFYYSFLIKKILKSFFFRWKRQANPNS